MWTQILLDGSILLALALVTLAWAASVVRAYRELRLQGLSRLDLAFWLALVIILPLVGFLVYRFARQVEAFLLPAAQPAGPGRRAATLLGSPANTPAGQDAAG
ncbi:MAG TPA: hypothetical protein VFF68_13520, partial [Anaerolineaceae bacterium]|nr:hypothetical protein [Anaerolineaceae bacterium]